MEVLLAAHEVATWKTVLFALLLVGLIVCLALEEKLHAKKSVIAGVFAIVCLLLGAVCNVLPFGKVVVGSHPLEAEQVVGDYHLDPDAEEAKPHHVEFPAPATDEQGADAQGSAEHTSAEQSEPSEDEHEFFIDGETISMPVYIPGIDWGVIAIILGSSLFVDVTSKSGLFTWIAVRVTKTSGGDPLLLLFSYGVMTVAFSAVLNNVTAMIIVGSLTAVSLDKLNRRQLLLGFLLIEGLLTNIGGLLTLISSVPNIIVGTTAGIGFVTFFLKAAPYVVVATGVTLWIGAKRFGIQRLTNQEDKDHARELVAGFDENDGVQSWGFFYFGAAMLVLFILLIATSSVLPFRIRHLGMGFIALAFAGVMLVRYKSEVDKFYKTVDWDLLGFFMALFVTIYVMEHAGVLGAIGSGLNLVLGDVKQNTAGIKDSAVLLFGSAVFSSVTDNIPLAAMLASILKDLGTPTALGGGAESGLWWSVVFGANLGGNLTPIGSASTLVAVTVMHKHKLAMSFAQFVKAAAPYAAIQIVLAALYVLIFLR